MVGSAGGQYTKSNQKNKRTDTDQTCTQANIVAAFPLITARDRRWWSHWHSLGPADMDICGDYAVEHEIALNCNKAIDVLFSPKKYRQLYETVSVIGVCVQYLTK